MTDLDTYDRAVRERLSADSHRRMFYRLNGPTKAQATQFKQRAQRATDAWTFEHGDHKPDGRVIHRSVGSAVCAMEQALQRKAAWVAMQDSLARQLLHLG